MESYFITVMILICINAIAACGLNIIVGFAGQISLGHAAFMGIGAYSAALLTTKAGIGFWPALPLVILITGLAGFLLGLPSLRVRDDFLAITTIGINFIVESVFQYIPFFGGALGIGGIPKIVFFGVALKGLTFLLLCLFSLAAVLLFSYWMAQSWAGLACFALREEESAAASVGISHVRYKLLAFVIGTSIAGFSGSLYAHFMGFISSSDFNFPYSVMMLCMIALGGMGKQFGPVLGALILGVLPEIFRPLVDYRILLYSAMLFVLIRYIPGGLLGEDGVLKKLMGKFRKPKIQLQTN